jgi:hypothetical protein
MAVNSAGEIFRPPSHTYHPTLYELLVGITGPFRNGRDALCTKMGFLPARAPILYTVGRWRSAHRPPHTTRCTGLRRWHRCTCFGRGDTRGTCRDCFATGLEHNQPTHSQIPSEHYLDRKNKSVSWAFVSVRLRLVFPFVSPCYECVALRLLCSNVWRHVA